MREARREELDEAGRRRAAGHEGDPRARSAGPLRGAPQRGDEVGVLGEVEVMRPGGDAGLGEGPGVVACRGRRRSRRGRCLRGPAPARPRRGRRRCARRGRALRGRGARREPRELRGGPRRGAARRGGRGLPPAPSTSTASIRAPMDATIQGVGSERRSWVRRGCAARSAPWPSQGRRSSLWPAPARRCCAPFPALIPAGVYGAGRFDPGLGMQVRAGEVLYTRSGVVRKRANPDGFLDVAHASAKPPGTLRVGFFGDSYVEAQPGSHRGDLLPACCRRSSRRARSRPSASGSRAGARSRPLAPST